MTSPIRVVLVDDHHIVRTGLKLLLREAAGVEIVGEAADGREALALADEHAPDVVLMDLSMEGLNGLEATARLRERHPRLRVIVLSMLATREAVLGAIQAGASGYLPKDCAPQELAAAIGAVCLGKRWFHPRIAALFPDGIPSEVESESDGAGPLTSRQREILQLIAEGQATKEIAFRLGLSPKTVEAHRANIMARLGIRDIAGLVRYAIRSGLASPDR